MSGAAYYVDGVDGNDTASGTTPGTPWKSLVRAQLASFATARTLLLKCGSIFRESLSLSAAKAPSGLTVGAYGSNCDGTNRPVISGADVVTSAWSHEAGTDHAIAALAGPVRELYWKGADLELLVPARYPNFGGIGAEFGASRAASAPSGTAIVVSSGDRTLFAGKEISGSKFYIKGFAYRVNTGRVTSYEPSSGRLDFDADLTRPVGAGSGYILEGKLWMLDAPREWHHDAEAGKLRLRLPGGALPAPASIEVVRRTVGISSTGVNDLLLDKLVIRQIDGDGIVIEGGTNVTIRDSEVRFARQNGIKLESGNRLHVENSSLRDCADRGILLGGGTATDQIVISDNLFQDIGMGIYPNTYAAIQGSSVRRYRITGNRIIRTGYNGLSLHQDTVEGLISDNYIQDTCQRLGDCGAIYVSRSLDPSQNLLIEKNFIYRTGSNMDGVQSGKIATGFGLYHDTEASYVKCVRNMVAHTEKPYNLHMGSNNIARENVFWGSGRTGIQTNDRGGFKDGDTPFIMKRNEMKGNYHFALPTDAQIPVIRLGLTFQNLTQFLTVNGNIIDGNKLVISGDPSHLQWVGDMGSSNKLNLNEWRSRVDPNMKVLTPDEAMSELRDLGFRPDWLEVLKREF